MDEEKKQGKEEKKEVEIMINGEKFRISRGEHSVEEIKKLGGVPLADILNELVKDSLVPLKDDGSVKVKDGDEFVSHPKDSSAS